MAKVITCPKCGAVVRGVSDDELADQFQEHAKAHDEHPTKEQALAMAMEEEEHRH